MATYIVLSRYTPVGIAKIREASARIDAARKTGLAMGAQLKAWYLVVGQYDVITLWEAPNDETMTKVNLLIASSGNVTTETLRAFTEDEFHRIITSLP